MSAIMNATIPLFSAPTGPVGEQGSFIIGVQDQGNRIGGTDNEDLALGGNENDVIFGLGGDDNLQGGGANDTLFGGEGKDTVFGGNDEDLLFGGDDNDELFGQSGDDTLRGGLGKDTLFGGEGADTFSFFPGQDGSEIDFIGDFDPTEDVIRLNGVSSDALVEYDSATGLLTVDGVALAQLSPGLDFTAENLEFANPNIINDPSHGPDNVIGTDGDDIVINGVGKDTILGGKGADIFVFDINDAKTTDDIDRIEDFNLEEGDSIRIEGITSADNVDYDRSTGILSVNGNKFLQIDPELPLQDGDFEFL